ncbi:unnamed protein product [Arctogadus glacialis]
MMLEMEELVNESNGMVKTLALICFLSLVMLMSILGNLLVMTAVCKDRQLRWVHDNLRASWVRSPKREKAWTS